MIIRHYTKESKVCELEECSKIFFRYTHLSRKEFNAKRFCSIQCRDRTRRLAQAAKQCSCGSTAPHYARGMCWTCYTKQQSDKQVKPGKLGPRQRAFKDA